MQSFFVGVAGLQYCDPAKRNVANKALVHFAPTILFFSIF
jgi:hypothetical protein